MLKENHLEYKTVESSDSDGVLGCFPLFKARTRQSGPLSGCSNSQLLLSLLSNNKLKKTQIETECIPLGIHEQWQTINQSFTNHSKNKKQKHVPEICHVSRDSGPSDKIEHESK